MGVDWIPCRVEADYTPAELTELVRREALHFRACGNSMASQYDPRIRFSEEEQARIRQSYLELGPLHWRLLFKRDSHRVSVIDSEELFPIEWRIDAERTILPWELGDQLAAWQNYRDEVKVGRHRSFLRQLYVYCHLLNLLTVDVYNLLPNVQRSLTATGGWAKRPEVAACREAILTGPLVTLPPPPEWPTGGGVADESAMATAFEKVDSAIVAWNNAVQRGNVRARRPKRPPAFEEWVADRLDNEWYDSFLKWVEPWKQGGYGLYRDCE